MIPATNKCLLLYTQYRPLIGGAQTVYDALAREAGGQIEVLTGYRDIHTGDEVPGWRDFDAAANYKIHRLPYVRARMGVSAFSNPFVWFLRSVQGRLIKRHLTNKVRSLLATGEYASVCLGDMPFLGWLLDDPDMFKGIRTIVYSHGEELSEDSHSEKSAALIQRSLAQADTHVAVSSFTVNILREKFGVDPSKIILSTNGVDLAYFNGQIKGGARERLGFPENSKCVFACGRLVERKGFDKLIEAWPVVLSSVADARLYIGGYGPLEMQLKERVTALGITDSVQFLGRVDDADLPSAYGLADVFTMPNRTMPSGDTEGFGLVFLEAAAMGTPSVGGRAGGAVDAILDGETGLFVDGNKPDEIAAALVTLLQDDKKRQAMAKACKIYAQTQGWGTKAEALVPLLCAPLAVGNASNG